MLVTLATYIPADTVARMFRIGDDAVWRVLYYYTNTARAQEDSSHLTALAIDETVARRGQDCITWFHDLRAPRVPYACEGRDQSTVDAFAKDLRAHGGDSDQIAAVCIEMSKAYIAGVTRVIPDPASTFDAFHVIQLSNQAMDQVRRRESTWVKSLKHSRWLWLKDNGDLSAKQTRFESLSRENLETGRAWRREGALRALYADAPWREQAEAELTRWVSWGPRRRMEPFKGLATTIEAHWDGILNVFGSRLTNRAIEVMNGLIQSSKARARGYRTARSLITMSCLITNTFGGRAA